MKNYRDSCGQKIELLAGVGNLPFAAECQPRGTIGLIKLNVLLDEVRFT